MPPIQLANTTKRVGTVPSIVDVEEAPKNSKLIILQRKNPLVLPVPHNPRFPVSDEDITHYRAIVELSYKENVQK